MGTLTIQARYGCANAIRDDREPDEINKRVRRSVAKMFRHDPPDPDDID
jgi:hypothetical protein